MQKIFKEYILMKRNIYTPLLKRWYKYIHFPALSLFHTLWRLRSSKNIVRIGSDYGGGWVIIEDLNSSSLVYSFGIGEDITFDKHLIQSTGCKVFGFDPTPKAARWVRKMDLSIPKEFEFLEVGLAEKTGHQNFFLPSNPNYVSGSLTKDLQGKSITCMFFTLQDILAKNGHNFIDLIKLDVEGAEYLILKSWLKTGYIPPARQIWIEFHPELAGYTIRSTLSLVRKLRRINLVSIKSIYPQYFLLINKKYVT